MHRTCEFLNKKLTGFVEMFSPPSSLMWYRGGGRGGNLFSDLGNEKFVKNIWNHSSQQLWSLQHSLRKGLSFHSLDLRLGLDHLVLTTHTLIKNNRICLDERYLSKIKEFNFSVLQPKFGSNFVRESFHVKKFFIPHTFCCRNAVF